MNKQIIQKWIYGLSLLFLFCQCEQERIKRVDYVNTLIGTNNNPSFSHGNTYPAVTPPWGMNFWTPQTGNMSDRWIYTYNADSIRGFRQTHLPSPWIGDYGTFSMMPVSGKLRVKDSDRALAFSHEEEIATPYYYAVKLQDDDIKAEITATERCGCLRFTFDKDEDHFIVLDAYHGGAWVKIIPEQKKIIGYCKNTSGGTPNNFANYFVICFDRSFDDFGTWDQQQIYAGQKELEGFYAGGYVRFPESAKQVNITVASSFISKEQAFRNLEQEIGNKSFTQIKESLEATWTKHLDRIEVDGGTEEQLRTFYSNFYRASLFPRKFYEYDEKGVPIHYSPFDGKVHKGYMYTDNGFWDTFRSLHPWLTMMFPSISTEIMQSLVNIYQEGGWLPNWASPGYRNSMIGSHAVSLIADAYQKGIRNFDIEKAYEAVRKDCFEPSPAPYMGRYGFQVYNEKGYIPYPEFEQSTSMSLEYAYDDFCIMTLADLLNKPEDKTLFAGRATNYIHSFDSSTGFMRPRKANGEWFEHFNGYLWGGPFTEGNAWQYSWSVFHDVQGLMNLMGGTEAFAYRLDSIFIAPVNSPLYGRDFNEVAEMHCAGLGQYAHGNQPAQHVSYLYNYAGQSWKTQRLVRKIMDRLYCSSSDGYCGDEDNGQTSSWYLFSALGFYPVCPGTGQYVLGSPLFPAVKLKLENGKEFRIEAPDNGPSAVYVKEKLLNNHIYPALYITHQDIQKGGVLTFKMGDKPQKNILIEKNDLPYSLSNNRHDNE